MYSNEHTKITIFHTEKIFHKLINSCLLIRIAQIIPHTIELKKSVEMIQVTYFFHHAEIQKWTISETPLHTYVTRYAPRIVGGLSFGWTKLVVFSSFLLFEITYRTWLWQWMTRCGMPFWISHVLRTYH